MMQIAVYVRQSQDKSGDEAGVDRQETACRKLAEAKGWENLTLYRDNDKSASNGKERPDFERLLRDIDAGRVTAVVVFHLDRLTRTIRDLTRVIEAGKTKRVNIACVHGVSLDLGDPTGVAVATILTAIAAMEVQHKGTRQKAANRQRAVAGKAFWTRRPFGYDRNEHGVFIVEQEAELIRSAADAVLAGSTLAAIAREWNRAGIRTTDVRKDAEGTITKAGGLWGVTQVRRLLLNPRYSGKRLYNGEEMEAGGMWQPILTEETQDALESLLTDPRRRTAPDDLNSKHLLSGICICGKCGHKMYASPMKSKGKEWMVYRCFGAYCITRRLDLVDDVVNAVIVGRLSRPDAARMFTASDDTAALRQKATDLRDRRDALAAMLADGLLSPSAVREQAGRLSTELHQVESALSSANSLNPAAEVIAADNVGEAWAGQPLGIRRQIIRALAGVTVLPAGKGTRFSPEQVKIEWKMA
ncbi:recombinase family protein [Pseudarthrobacter oxydans]|uniref:recombinase family protein n=1 Tax=Pseudarthrobacter oxydans TaxID=1671 RepID=UPI002AA60AA4|nr:recombinase family protein [Pseudarthrobacter oxydans]WPU08090.1 recombinase family protein [Pseudarthrobacter oxydans]